MIELRLGRLKLSLTAAQSECETLAVFIWLSRKDEVSRGPGKPGRQAGDGFSATCLDVRCINATPSPTLHEQRRIVTILDKADAVRRKRQEAILLTDELLRSAFLEMFGDPVLNPKGWEVVSLDQIADINSGITKGRKLNGKATVSVPYMCVSNVQDGYLDLKNVKEIDATSDEIERYALRDGDVLLTEGGDPDKLGRGTVWRSELSECIHQNHIFSVRIRKQELIRPEFLGAQIGSSRGKRYSLRAAKQTTGIATINKTQLSAYPCLLPPVALQRRYAEVEKCYHALMLSHKRNSAEIGALFSALVQRAFHGELQ